MDGEQQLVWFRCRTLVVGNELQVNNCSCWLEMENRSALRTENDSGELQMEN